MLRASFSFRGRIDRRTFGVGLLAWLCAVVGVAFFVSEFRFGRYLGPQSLIGLVVVAGVIAVWAGVLSLIVRRLHDCGWSAFWPLATIAILFGISAILETVANFRLGLPALLSLLLLIGASLVPGDRQANRFGSAPPAFMSIGSPDGAVAKADHSASGHQGPMPAVQAAKAISRLRAGGTLEVETKDPSVVAALQEVCRAAGHTIVDQSEASGIYRLLITHADRAKREPPLRGGS